MLIKSVIMRIELRTCVHCGEEKEIEQTKKYANNICKKCQLDRAREHARKKAIEDGRRIGVMGRFPYPLEEEYSYLRQKHNSIQAVMNKIKIREDWINQIRINLDKTLSNPILMEWIHAHKNDEPKPKKQSKIHKSYPDTRYITWEEYTEGLGSDDVDS